MTKIELHELSDSERQEVINRREQRDALTVNFWWVCRDIIQSDQTLMYSYPLSDLFDDPKKAENYLEIALQEYPDAYICEARKFFNAARPGDIEYRQAFINTLH